MHTGEGAFRRERNAGKNTSVYLRWNVADNGRLSMNCMVKMDRMVLAHNPIIVRVFDWHPTLGTLIGMQVCLR